MAVTLRAMTDAEVTAFVTASRDAYVAERVAAGEDPARASETADAQIRSSFPDGRPAPDQLVYRVEEDTRPVGSLWIGPAEPAQPESWWVWEITIDAGHRGRGLGRAAMLLAEDCARSQGARRLGLNVFGHNAIGRRFYEHLGYSTTAVRMSKML